MEKREQIVRVLLTGAEKEQIAAAAQEAGVPVAVWVRMMALAAAKRS